MTQSLFITGTDTDVGKTLVTALLALHLQSLGIDVGVMKPFASGCRRENDELISEDAWWLKEVTGVSDSLDLMNPVRFEEPLAPLAAARRVGESSGEHHLEHCLDALRTLQARHECVLVEGVGGLMVPLFDRRSGGVYNCLDFANDLKLPVALVTRRTLGTINHTLLTCQAPLQAPAFFAGIVFCDAQPVPENDIAAEGSPAIVEELSALPVWGRVPHLRDLSRESLQVSANLYLSDFCGI